MSEYKATSTAYIGDPASLKGHSLLKIEQCLSNALSRLTGEALVVDLNNSQFVASAPGYLIGEKVKARFDVVVSSQTKEIDTPF